LSNAFVMLVWYRPYTSTFSKALTSNCFKLCYSTDWTITVHSEHSAALL